MTMPEKQPERPDWFSRLSWILLVGWLLLGVTQCEPQSGPGSDCQRVGAAEWGSDC